MERGTAGFQSFLLLGGGKLSAGGIAIDRGGVLEGPGTVNAHVLTNDGQVRVGGTNGVGTLILNGDYKQESDGVLIFNITANKNQWAPPSLFTVSGVATFAGGSFDVEIIGKVPPDL